MKKILISIINLKGISGAVNYITQTSTISKEKYGLEINVLTAKKEEKNYPFEVSTIPLIKNMHGYSKRYLFSKYSNFISKKYSLLNGHGDLLNQDVLTLHNLIQRTYEKLNKPIDGLWKFHDKMLSEKKFTFIIANSIFMKKDIISRFKIPEERVRVVYPSYNPSITKLKNGKEQSKKLIGLNPEGFCFLLPASGDFLKRGVNRFIDIFLKIYNENKNCQAIITGKDSNLKKYLSKISDMGLSNNIKIIEPIKDVNIIYESADCIIYPAVLEEFGIALMEGMVCKIPVLCTQEIGVTELMTEEIKKFSLCLSDQDFISKALMLINKQVSQDMFNDNAIHISQRTWEKTSDDIYKVYTEFFKLKHSDKNNTY